MLGCESANNTILLADDQIIIRGIEDNLQYSIFQLDKMYSEYDLRISATKTKIMASGGNGLQDQGQWLGI